MTYITEIQTVEVQGIPRIEYRTEPPIVTEICITFTPTYSDDDYGYDNPRFIWGDEVAVVGEWEDVQNNELSDELNFYRIKAIKLVEPTITVNGKKRLKDAPSWEYGIRDRHCTYELIWFLEEELVSKREVFEEIVVF